MKNTQKQKIFTVIIDETNKLKERDIRNYLLKYFNRNELNHIKYIRRYNMKDTYWKVEMISGNSMTVKTLKDLVVSLISNDVFLNELVGGIY